MTLRRSCDEDINRRYDPLLCQTRRLSLWGRKKTPPKATPVCKDKKIERKDERERERERERVSACLCVRVPIIDDERAFFPVAQVK